MARPDQATLDLIKDEVARIPPDRLSKCALCNDTLTHIVKTIEAKTGGGTATVARMVADEINKTATPGDRVSGEKLRNRINNQERVKCVNNTDKTPDPLTWTCSDCGGDFPVDQEDCNCGKGKTHTPIAVRTVNQEPMKEPVTFDAADEDDLKLVGEVIAEKIRSGEAGVRVGKVVASAVKQTMKEMGPPPEPKPVNNFDRLWKHGLSFVEGITFWADGTMVPTTEDERIAAAGVRAVIPSIIIYAARLGIDVNAVLKLGCNAAQVAPGHMIEGRKEEKHPVIDV